MTPEAMARMLIGMTLGFHIILAVSGLALPLFLSVAEFLALRRGDPDYMLLARQGSKAFTAIFAIGAVTGTLVAVELVLTWAPFMAVASQVIILPFFIEGFAFVLEAMFVGMYLYGWDRFKSPWAHWWLTLPIAVASAASGLLITVVNTWMNAPSGFRIVAGKIVDVNPWQAFFNPAMFVEDAHVFFMSYTMVGMLLLTLAAWELLRRPHGGVAQKAAKLSAWVALVALAFTIVTGDVSGKWLALHQPEKLAAAEALFRTLARAPETVGGIVNAQQQTVYAAIRIPGLLSFLAFGNFYHPVLGLSAFARDTWPPVGIVHTTFTVMVGLGTLMFALTLVFLWRTRRGGWPRWLLWAAVGGGPAAVIAMECGWLVDEFGRQPWVVYHVMRVSAGVTHQAAVIPLGILILVLLVAIFASVPYVLLRVLRGAIAPPAQRETV